jgi:cytochrome c biogenesis protein CcdA
VQLIDQHNIGLITFSLAFVVGLASFLSPCVLPLVPAYVGYMSSTSVTSAGAQSGRARTGAHALAFVLGFSAVFVLVFGVAAGLGMLWIQDAADSLTRVGAVLIMVLAVRFLDMRLAAKWWLLAAAAVVAANVWISTASLAERIAVGATLGAVMLTGADLSDLARASVSLSVAGLHVLASYLRGPLSRETDIAGIPVVGILEAAIMVLVVYFGSRTALFYTDRRMQLGESLRGRGLMTSLGMGSVFAAGWSPCIGVNLTAILGIAMSTDRWPVGALLLAAFSLGMGVPFLLVGFFFDSASNLIKRLRPHMGIIKVVNAALLVFMALLLLSNRLAMLAAGTGVFDL